MKVVINKCFGGFSLSARAVARLAELKGRPCYFFRKPLIVGGGLNTPYEPITLEEADDPRTFIFYAFDIPNPNEVFRTEANRHEMPMDERRAHNETYQRHQHESRPNERHDPHLVQAVEELGEAANGKHAKLRVVEIPDGVSYEIDDYDGQEHIAEVRRTW